MSTHSIMPIDAQRVRRKYITLTTKIDPVLPMNLPKMILDLRRLYFCTMAERAVVLLPSTIAKIAVFAGTLKKVKIARFPLDNRQVARHIGLATCYLLVRATYFLVRASYLLFRSCVMLTFYMEYILYIPFESSIVIGQLFTTYCQYTHLVHSASVKSHWETGHNYAPVKIYALRLHGHIEHRSPHEATCA